MCGFGGILNSKENVTRQQIQNIAAKVAFRGPDSCGIKVLKENLENTDAGPHALFFNRLAIVDLDCRSDQPFENERYLLTFNGEIYNYPELKTELQRKGVRFHTTSDTEVLFHLLLEYGSEALPKLNGMFSLFWLDKKDHRFLIARDRLGIKPLYYSHVNNSFLFSSELNSIRLLSGGQHKISSEAVEMYLWMQFVPTPFTILEGIYKLQPGHFIEGDIGQTAQLDSKPYWDAYSFVSESAEETGDLEQILNRSLSRQLHADVPLGLFLSSGVDSSLLAALVNKYHAKENTVNFFTVKFEQRTLSDESSEAAEFIEKFNNPHLRCRTISINPSVIRSCVEDLYSYYDEPFGDMAAVLNWLVSQKAREYVTVALSGDGADELFWGYPRYSRWQKFDRINKLPGAAMARALVKAMPHSKLADNASFLLEKDPIKRHFNFFLPSGMRFKINDPITRFPIWALENVQAIKDRPDTTAVLDIKTYLADAMLYKVDRSSMASSLEVRVPFLDNEVLQYALRLSLGRKSNSAFRHKAPLKELLQKLAPQYQPHRPKKGFSFPLEKWLMNDWKDMVLQTVNKADLENAGLDPVPYMKLISDFYASKNRHFTDVWYIFNLSLWMEKSKTIG